MNSDEGKQEQFQIGTFPDLTTFDELEKKIADILKRFQRLQAENAGLKADLQTQKEELEQLQQQTRMVQAFQKKEDLIREKVHALLNKLESFQSA